MKKGKKRGKEKKDQDSFGDLAKDLNNVTVEQGRKDQQQSRKSYQKFTTELSDGDSSNTYKPLRKNKPGFNALADGEETRSQSIEGVKSHLSGKVKVRLALPELENRDLDSAKENKNRDSEKEKNVRNNSKKDTKVIQSVELDDDTNNKEETSGMKRKKQRKKQQDEDEDIQKVLAELEMEYFGIKQVVAQKEPQNDKDISDENWKKDKKKKNKADTEKREPMTMESQEKPKEIVGCEEIERIVKTAAQKKKNQRKMTQNEQEAVKKVEESQAQKPETKIVVSVESGTKAALKAIEDKEPDVSAVSEDGNHADDGDNKKKKKIGKEEEKAKNKRKGPRKQTIAAMQEALKKLHEEEERLAREEAERIRKEEEAEKAREEQRLLELKRKEKKKLKEKERKQRLKAEGKLLTVKQKADRSRAQAMLEALIAQGLEMPSAEEKKAPRPGTRVRSKAKQQTSTEEQQQPEEQKVEVQVIDSLASEKKEVDEVKNTSEQEEHVKDAWDDESSDEDEVVHSNESSVKLEVTAQQEEGKESEKDRNDEGNDKKSETDDESDESISEEGNDSEDEHKTDAERRRERALTMIQSRREEAEKNRSLDVLRAAVVCVLGHVDTGKTKILDKLRRTNVQDGEAGGITQQIGATNVPISAIKEQIKFVERFVDAELRIPGLLIIDTPGHESFSNLRSRGSSLCDIAILVVDIMHGLEPQTIESLNLLKSKKTPFIVALNKIDRLYDWKTMNRKDIRNVIKAQAPHTQLEFEHRTKQVVLQFAEQGLNASLFYDNPDIRRYVSLVPTSAITGDGIGNLLALIVDSCQNMLDKRLMYSEELQATVLEVKVVPGLGTTIDAILVNGRLHEGDTIVLAGTDGPIVTQIRSLLMPQPMNELRVKNAYVEYKEIQAAQGIKIAGKDLEKAIAGLNLQVAQKPDEVDILREEVSRDLRSALSNIKLQERGVYVQASTLGSLEALLEFLRTSKIPYSNIRIGPVVKKDVMKASTMLEHENQYATILAFDVKVERDAQDLADSLGVKIFQADIIYHLFDKFMAYREELRQRKREEFKHIAVFPCKLKVLPQFIFNSRDPIVMGVMIEAGIIKEGTPICVPSREFVDLGVVTSIEVNHKAVESARKGQEVCIKIEPISGEAPKMFGRHFDEKDFLVSKISRQSIDACKDYFRDSLVNTDWQLMIELKKLFQIL